MPEIDPSTAPAAAIVQDLPPVIAINDNDVVPLGQGVRDLNGATVAQLRDALAPTSDQIGAITDDLPLLRALAADLAQGAGSDMRAAAVAAGQVTDAAAASIAAGAEAGTARDDAFSARDATIAAKAVTTAAKALALDARDGAMAARDEVVGETATVKDRANHTGVQPIATIEGLPSALDGLATFTAVGAGAVARPIVVKAAEAVTIEDFLGDDVAAAFEAACGAAKVVGLGHGASYVLARAPVIPVGVSIVGNEAHISFAEDFSDDMGLHLLGGNSLLGRAYIAGATLPVPAGTWAGATLAPRGTGIYVGPPTTADGPAGAPVTIDAWQVSGCPSGAIFARRTPVKVGRQCLFDDNQTASVIWKAAGVYTGITTTNAGTANAPIGERVTAAVIETYKCDDVLVEAELRRVRSKGVSIGVGRNPQVKGCRATGSTPRHGLVHITQCIGGIYADNQIDGGVNYGHGFKADLSDGLVFSPSTMRNVSVGYMMQSCRNFTGATGGVFEFQGNAYHLAIYDNAEWNMSGINIRPGTTQTSVAGAVHLVLATDAAAIAAGKTMDGITIDGGEYIGGSGGFNHAGYGLNPSLRNIRLIGGARFVGQTEFGVVMRVESGEIDARFDGVALPFAFGTLTGHPGSMFEGKISANGCSGVIAAIGATSDLQLANLSLDVKAHGGGTRAVQLLLDDADSLGVLNLKVDATDMTDRLASVYIGLAGKAVKARIDINTFDRASGDPNNVTFGGAGALTGKLIANAGISGAHAMAVI